MLPKSLNTNSDYHSSNQKYLPHTAQIISNTKQHLRKSVKASAGALASLRQESSEKAQDLMRANRNEFLEKLQKGMSIAPGLKPNYVK